MKLTLMQTGVAALLLDGYRAKEIADILGRSIQRVEVLMRQLKARTGARTLVQLGAALERSGWPDVGAARG